MIKNRVLALVYRSAAFLAVLFGIFLVGGVFGGEVRPGLFLYYTVQSNIVVLVYFLVSAIKTAAVLKQDGAAGTCGFFPRVQAGVLLCIFLTFIVFWAILAPFMAGVKGYLASYENLSVHLVCPLLMIADYIFFSQSAKLKKVDPIINLAVPLIYLAEALSVGFSGAATFSMNGQIETTRFPYYFINFDLAGYMILLYIPLMALFYYGMGRLLLYIDGKRKATV